MRASGTENPAFLRDAFRHLRIRQTGWALKQKTESSPCIEVGEMLGELSYLRLIPHLIWRRLEVDDTRPDLGMQDEWSTVGKWRGGKSSFERPHCTDAREF